ncbi:PDZ domain-containing protein [bacterium]|jgi:hypothetical protein|nr:PDZ domain-containing protein [Verrucomicrobiota bacterium]MDA7633381.1 PDZ domain-containing protein [bacterium]
MNQIASFTLISMLVGITGCASRDTVYSRGWIGGEFAEVKPARTQIGKERLELVADPPNQLKGAVLVKAVYSETPLAVGRFEPGDLIVEIDGVSVSDIHELQTLIERARPGHHMTAGVWRAGESLDLPLRIGREHYSIERSVNLGFRFKSHVDLLPDRDFSLFMVSWERNDDRLQLQSPDLPTEGRVNSKDEAIGHWSPEGWEVWLGFAGSSARKLILDQEVMLPESTMAVLSAGG